MRVLRTDDPRITADVDDLVQLITERAGAYDAPPGIVVAVMVFQLREELARELQRCCAQCALSVWKLSDELIEAANEAHDDQLRGRPN